MLQDASEVLGAARQAAVCRELTKKFEEVLRGSLDALAADLAARPVKGEVVVLIDRARSDSVNQKDVTVDLRAALASHSMRDAVDLVAQAHNLPRRQIYKLALEMSKE